MEAVRQSSDDSFSYGWLSNMKQSIDFLEESLRRSADTNSFIEVDPDFFSMRWIDLRNFDFDHPSCEASLVVNADHLLLSSHLLPLHHVDPLKSREGPLPSFDSVLALPKSSLSQSKSWYSSVSTNPPPSLYSSDSMFQSSCVNKQSTKSPVKVLRKYLYFLLPLYKRVRKLKLISSKPPRRIYKLPRSSPRMSNASSNIDQRRGGRVFDVEPASSIHDAVLHCKKSIANSYAEEKSD